MDSLQQVVDRINAIQELAFWGPLLRASLILVAGWLFASVASRLVVRATNRVLDAQQIMLLGRFVHYGLLSGAILSAMHALGFNPAVLVGTAGVITVAIGFASQTSASNVISGLFLVGERSFAVGDRIRIGETVGEVLSIDMLSVKLRTLDNLYVRIPNETMLKSEVTNIGRFPIRRFELLVGVAYDTDLDHVRQVLLDVAHQDPLVLEDPAPGVWFGGFGDSSMNLRFLVWTARENYFSVLNRVPERVKRAFDAEGIQIPFPQRTLHFAPPANPDEHVHVRIEPPPAPAASPPETSPAATSLPGASHTPR